MFIKKLFFLIFILCVSFKANAQNYNINVMPARLIFNNAQRAELLLIFKYIEVERRLNNRYSINIGVYYDRKKEENALGGYRDLFYNIDPSVRYYLNDKKNLSGFYFGIGINYGQFKYQTFGRNADSNGNIIERNRNSEIINFNLTGGYKLVFFKNRISIDFKLNQALNLLSKEVTTTLISNGSEIETSNNLGQNSIGYPFLDLKLGYRFGFKK